MESLVAKAQKEGAIPKKISHDRAGWCLPSPHHNHTFSLVYKCLVRNLGLGCLIIYGG